MDDTTGARGETPGPEGENTADQTSADAVDETNPPAEQPAEGEVGEPATDSAGADDAAAAESDTASDSGHDESTAPTDETATDGAETAADGAETAADAAAAAATGPRPERRRLGRGAIIAIVIGAIVVVALLVVGIIAAVNAARAAAEQPRKDAAASVRAYLTAVSHSDAAAALKRIESPDKLDATLLTDDVLKASNHTAALTGIHVVVPTSDAGSADTMHVTASYTLGSTPVTTAFDLHTDADGAWLIGDGTGKVTVSTTGLTGLALDVNGAKIAGAAELDAFPGTYTLGTTTAGFAIAGTPEVTVKDVESTPSLAATAQLTASGLQVYRFALDKAVKGCISSTKLKAGCGLTLQSKLADGTTLEDGTVQRSLPAATKAKLATVKPNDAASDGIKRATDPLGSVTVTVKCTKGGTKGTCQIANGTATYLGASTVDLSQKPPAVSWTAQ